MIINKTRKPVYGAEFDIGTTYYVTNLEDLLKACEKENVFLYYSLALSGFKALNMRSMFGSGVIDDLLYICETNGKDINVEGENVDPEKALEKFSKNIDSLAAYIQPADEKIIHKNITTYELDLKLLKDQLDDIAIQALDDGAGLEQIVKDYSELKL